MKTKLRLLACVMAVVCCMTALSVTAFAASDGGYYESNEDGDNTPPSSIDSITVSTEGVKLPENQGSEPLTPDGNLSLIDDVLQSNPYASDEGVTVGDKQFITVQSKSGNYFYIVIDRSGDTENVYFLNLVDEADLMALMEDADGNDTTACTCTEKCAAGDVNTACPVCKTNMSECAGKEAELEPTKEPDTDPDADSTQEPEPEKKSNSGLLLIVFVLALAGGGAVYWFKFRKKKPDTKGPADLDDYDYGEEDDEEMEYETEEDTPDEASPAGEDDK